MSSLKIQGLNVAILEFKVTSRTFSLPGRQASIDASLAKSVHAFDKDMGSQLVIACRAAQNGHKLLNLNLQFFFVGGGGTGR